MADLENKIAAQQTQLESTQTALKGVQGQLAATQKELARCTAEGEGMRDEVGANLRSRTVSSSETELLP